MFFNSIAFLEFKNRTIARKVQKKKQVVKIQDRVLIVDFVGEARSKVTKVNDKDKKGKSLGIYKCSVHSQCYTIAMKYLFFVFIFGPVNLTWTQ